MEKHAASRGDAVEHFHAPLSVIARWDRDRAKVYWSPVGPLAAIMPGLWRGRFSATEMPFPRFPLPLSLY
eukprot:4220396-Pyramimonas_sp.AAC.1